MFGNNYARKPLALWTTVAMCPLGQQRWRVGLVLCSVGRHASMQNSIPRIKLLRRLVSSKTPFFRQGKIFDWTACPSPCNLLYSTDMVHGYCSYITGRNTGPCIMDHMTTCQARSFRSSPPKPLLTWACAARCLALVAATREQGSLQLMKPGRTPNMPIYMWSPCPTTSRPSLPSAQIVGH